MHKKSRVRIGWEMCKVEQSLKEEGFKVIQSHGSKGLVFRMLFHLQHDKPFDWIAVTETSFTLVKYFKEEPTQQDKDRAFKTRSEYFAHPMRLYWKGAFGAMRWEFV